MHPLEPLSSEEITRAVEIFAHDGLIARVVLDEPTKDELRAGSGSDAVERRAAITLVPGPGAGVLEAIVSLTDGCVVSIEDAPDARPALLFEDSINAIVAVMENDEFKAAMKRRGIGEDEIANGNVQLDPWPAGTFGIPHEEGRRITRVIAFYRDEPTDNGYAKPIEGVVVIVDMGRGEVLEVQDHGGVPIPKDKGSYKLADNEPARADLQPLEITQPNGPSFTLDGHHLAWQKWSVRVSMDPYEGLVLHAIAYDGRSIAHRMSISEMVVPYGDPGPLHGWKNAFDAGEWGLGRMVNSLELGCDCLGEIRYLDAVFADEHGKPQVHKNAVCIHEEDYGILWKHWDMQGGTTEVRRSRRLVVSSISTVGNYEYGFFWYFYLDGTIQLEVKLTGIMSTMAVGDIRPSHATVVAPGLAAPYHQHLFCARLDLDIDDGPNEVHEVDVVPDPQSADHAFKPHVTRFERERDAQRVVDPSKSRTWRIVNPRVRNHVGDPVAYKLVPGSTPTLLADPESSVGRRARFATKNLWVTPYAPRERRAAGSHPNQSAGGDGLPQWTQADRSLVDTDVVLLHTFGVTHIPRPEDWPVMPVEYAGFSLVPCGFFDRNPALDVPPPDHCKEH
jgi:primary-amine oxidase